MRTTAAGPLSVHIPRLSESLTGTSTWAQNTAGNLSSAVTQAADGTMTIPLAGSKQVGSTTVPDLDDAVVSYMAFPMLNANGRPLLFSDRWTMSLRLNPGGVAVGDNVALAFAVATHPDPSNAAIKGVIATSQWLASLTNARIRTHTWSSGTVAAELNGTASANLDQFDATVANFPAGASGTSILWMQSVVGTWSDGGRLVGVGVDQSSSPSGMGSGQVYGILAAYRLLSTDTDAITPTMLASYSPPVVAA